MIVSFWYEIYIFFFNVYLIWDTLRNKKTRHQKHSSIHILVSRNEDGYTKHVWTLHTLPSTSIKCKHKQNQPVIVVVVVGFFFLLVKEAKNNKMSKTPNWKFNSIKKKKTSSDNNADFRSHPPKLYTQSHPIETSLFHSLSHTHAKLKNSLNHSHLYIATQNPTLFGHFNQRLSLSLSLSLSNIWS